MLETETPVSIQTPLVAKDGSTQYYEGSYVPRHDANGRVSGLIGYFRNVTYRESAEQALQEKRGALPRYT